MSRSSERAKRAEAPRALEPDHHHALRACSGQGSRNSDRRSRDAHAASIDDGLAAGVAEQDDKRRARRRERAAADPLLKRRRRAQRRERTATHDRHGCGVGGWPWLYEYAQESTFLKGFRVSFHSMYIGLFFASACTAVHVFQGSHALTNGLLGARGPGSPIANHRRQPTIRGDMASHSYDRSIRGSGGTAPCCNRGPIRGAGSRILAAW